METVAQSLNDLVVEDNPSLHLSPNTVEEPVVFYSEEPSKELVLEMHDPEQAHSNIEVSEPHEFEIVVQDLPGVDQLNPEKEKELEVVDDDVSMNASDSDENSKKSKSKEKDKFDLKSILHKGQNAVLSAASELLNNVPKHSGYDESGLERAIKYMEKFDDAISDVMCADLDGVLDANKVEEIRSKVDDGIARLHARYDKISKKRSRKKKSEEMLGMVKEAQSTKAVAIQGIVITVPILILRAAQTIANGVVTAGKDIEDLFERQCKEYAFDKREKMELISLLENMGHYIRRDLGVPLDQEIDQTSPENYTWVPNYQV